MDDKHIPVYNITYVQNRLNGHNYVNSYIITKDGSFTIDLFDDSAYGTFTNQTVNLLRSFVLYADKRCSYTGYNKIVKKYTINFLNTQPVTPAQKAAKRHRYTSINKSKKNLKVASNLLYTDILLDEPIRWRILSRLYFRYKYKVNLGQMHFRFKINRPVHYVNGVDSTAPFDENTVYFFLNQKTMRAKLKPLIIDANNNVKGAEHKLLSELFDVALALFFIQLSHSTLSWKDLNIDMLMLLIVSILNRTFDHQVDWIACNHMTMVNKLKPYLQKSISNGIEYEAIRLSKKFSFNINQCMFPEQWDKTMKAQWKFQRCIQYMYPKQVKQRKDYDKFKVIEMYKNGKSVSEIALYFNISERTVYRVIKSHKQSNP